MKNMTVRGIDPMLEKQIKLIAKKEGKSVNQVIIDSLRKFYGLEKRKKFTRVHHDMDHLFGQWTEDEFQQVQGKIDSERKVDAEIWNE